MTKVTLDKNGLATSAGTLTVYNFDGKSGEFTGASDEYLMQGVGLPGSACTVAPPAGKTGSVAIYRDGGWLVAADHRGETVYAIADGSPVLLTEPGDYPADTTPLKPATAWDNWDGSKWVTDAAAQNAADIEAAEKQQAALINEANSVAQAWQTQLRLDMITDDDKASLTAWMKYIQAVQTTDISGAPNINWPALPA